MIRVHCTVSRYGRKWCHGKINALNDEVNNVAVTAKEKQAGEGTSSRGSKWPSNGKYSEVMMARRNCCLYGLNTGTVKELLRWTVSDKKNDQWLCDTPWRR